MRIHHVVKLEHARTHDSETLNVRQPLSFGSRKAGAI